jgi:hypothetical protein
VSNNGGSNWTTLNTITGQQQTAKTDAWREQIVNLSAYAGDTVIIRIRHVVSAFGNATDVAIDDLAIYEQPPPMISPLAGRAEELLIGSLNMDLQALLQELEPL